MKYAIVFTEELMSGDDKKTYKISVPDLPGCSANAVTIDIGIDKITEQIKSHLSILAEYGEKIPVSLGIESNRKAFALENPHTFSQAFWAVVDVDITMYLGKSHKINVTLPELLIKQIDDCVSKSKSYKTRSGFIACACLAELKTN